MTAYFALIFAILAELVATVALRVSIKGSKYWLIVVVAGYLLAFILLTYTLSTGFPLGTAYGIWVSTGVALTAVIGHFLFKERLTWKMVFGISLIAFGVFLIEAGGSS